MTNFESLGVEAGSPFAPGNRFLAELRAGRSRPLIIAHRGDSAHAPENTLDAAQRGWESGADAWEIDVQMTRDGVAVVIHDESLTRTTDVAGRFPGDARADSGYLVADFDFDEIRSLDAGSWFLAESNDPRSAAGFKTRESLGEKACARFASGEVSVPTLRECLEFTRRRNWLVNIELKSFPNPDPRLLETVNAEVAAVGIAEHVLISSFDHRDVARAAESGQPWATGALTASPLFRPERYISEIVGADCFHMSSLCLGAASSRYLRRPVPENLLLSELLALINTRIPVLVFTVDDPRPDGLAAQLARNGVAGLFSDDPAPLRALFTNPPK